MSQNLIFTAQAPTESRVVPKPNLGTLHSLPARTWLQASRRLRIRDVTQVANDGSACVPKSSYTGPEIATPISGRAQRPGRVHDSWGLPALPSNQERPAPRPAKLQTMLFTKIKFRGQRSAADVSAVRRLREQRAPFGVVRRPPCRKSGPDPYAINAAKDRANWAREPASWARRSGIPHHQRPFAF